jgi:hypothetical protein
MKTYISPPPPQHTPHPPHPPTVILCALSLQQEKVVIYSDHMHHQKYFHSLRSTWSLCRVKNYFDTRQVDIRRFTTSI